MSRDFLLAETARKLESLVVKGTIAKISDDFRFADVEFEDGIVEELPILERSTIKGKNNFNTPLQPGEIAVILCPGGEVTQGIIIGVLRTEENKRENNNPSYTFEDGTEVSYDEKEGRLTILIKEKEVVKTKVMVSKTECRVEAPKIVCIADEHVLVSSTGKDTYTAKKALMGVVTGECLCAFTGTPHADKSGKIFAEK